MRICARCSSVGAPRSARLASFCSACSVSSSVVSSRQRSSAASSRVDRRVVDVAAARERGAHGVGVAADEPEVEHAPGSGATAPVAGVAAAAASRPVQWKPFAALPLPAGRGPSRLAPAYRATNSATCCACSPTTMFCGMIAPEKPPFSIA